MTEFELRKELEIERRSMGGTCPLCGSDQFELHEILVDDVPKYDLNRLLNSANEQLVSFIQFSMFKQNGEVKIDIESSRVSNKQFNKAVFKMLAEGSFEDLNPSYVEFDTGTFVLSVSGGYDFEEEKVQIRQQRFWSQGFSRKEQQDFIRAYLNYQKIDW